MEPWQELFEASFDIQAQDIKNTLETIPASKGVLLFTDSNHKPIQLVITANLRRLISNRTERLQEDHLSKQANILKTASFVYYKPTWNNFRTRLFYNRAVDLCFPDTKSEWLDLPKQHFVILDRTQKCACFQIIEKPKFSKKKDCYLYGLFPSRKSADYYCHVLNTVHGLCRNPSLACSSKANACSYFQMNLCSGYCIGNISRETYYGHVEKAIHFSSYERRFLYIENLKPHMKHLGRIQEYEKAQRIKEKIELLKSLDTPSYNWTGLLHGMDLFHMNRSFKTEVEGQRKKQQTYDLFRISWGCVHVMENVLIENLKIALQKILLEPDRKLEFTKNRVLEHLATVSWFIYRKSSKGLWTRNSNTEDLLKQIHETFPETIEEAQKKDAEQNSAS